MKKIDYTTYKKPSDFIKFSEGETRVRVISEGFFGYNHYLKTATRFVPLGVCIGRDCPHCAKDNEPKQEWAWIILNRNDKQVYLMRTGAMIGNALAELGNKQGDPRDYDVIITRRGEGKSTKYTVEPSPDSIEITDEEKLSAATRKPILVRKYFNGN